MRVFAVALLLMLSLSRQSAVATDVGYELKTYNLTSVDQPQVAELSGVEIKDRVWAAPGIQEAYGQLEPPRRFDFEARQRLRIEGSGCCPPEWLDDAAWPRTRELWGLGCNDSPIDLRMTFGGITLQR